MQVKKTNGSYTKTLQGNKEVLREISRAGVEFFEFNFSHADTKMVAETC